jgi:multiple antibiotic resistance protein
LAFVPIFVAVDAIGILPIFLSFSYGLSFKGKYTIVYKAIITAIILALSFILFGQWIFKLLGITMGDFMIAGGIILFCLSMIDMLMDEKKRRRPKEELAVVPLATPLIVSSAVLATSLMLLFEYRIFLVAFSVVVNIILAGIIFLFSEVLCRILSPSVIKAISKISSLLLATIAVMMIRKGVEFFVNSAKF